jgi:uncharacterized OB-fold protein
VDLPLPEPTELSRPYWDALRDGRLLIQRCGCGHAWLPARRECPKCLAPDPRWEPASGRGALVSWVVYHTAYHPAFESRLPYHVALVALDEGPHLITNIVDGHAALTPDAPVELEVEWEGETALARFRLRDATGTGANP